MVKKMIRKIVAIALVSLILIGCGSEPSDPDKIVVGASIVPHAEILEEARDALKEKGYELGIVEYTDYVQPNLALDAKDLDANYFQHGPYLEFFNEEHNLTNVSVGKIHYEPFGIYRGSKSELSELESGDKISVPNDTTNEARALALLEQEGLITLNEEAGLNATKLDIIENPLNLDIIELDAAQLAKSIDDVAFSVINGNFALQDGLTADDVVAFESKDSVGAETFANVVAVRESDKDSEKTKALIDVLQTDAIREFIAEKYKGAVEASY